MRALLLAAGLGTRLRPITNNIPKCLVPIKGKPLLNIWLEQLSNAGVGEFLINTHYLSEQVENFIINSKYKNKTKLIYEKELVGTAGTVIANLDFFKGDDCMLIHADNYCMADLVAFQQAHFKRPTNCIMTMMTFRTADPSSCGIVKIDDYGVVKEFYEKNTLVKGNLANAAVYILSQELLEKLGTDLNDLKDFSTEVINLLIGRIFTYETHETLIDIGTVKSYKIANL